MKKILIVFAILLIIGVIAISITTRTTEEILTNHPMIGQIFNAGDSVYYMEDCNNFNSCGDTPKSKEINRSLVCGSLNSTITPIYNNSYQIPDETTFEITELLLIKSYGLQIGGGSNHALAVLKDNKGLLSTRLFSFINLLDQPWGFKNGNICDGRGR